MRTLCLIGATSSYKQTPWHQKDAEFWGLTWRCNTMTRAHRFFEMHDVSCWDQFAPRRRQAEIIRTMNRWGVPVTMRTPHPEIRTAEPFPFDEIKARFQPYMLGNSAHYYTSSFAYMLALALIQDPLPEELRLYGVRLSTQTEYVTQRPAVEFWLGIAIGMGIKVYNHPESYVMRTRAQYGTPEWFEQGGPEQALRRAKAGLVA